MSVRILAAHRHGPLPALRPVALLAVLALLFCLYVPQAHGQPASGGAPTLSPVLAPVVQDTIVAPDVSASFESALKKAEDELADKTRPLVMAFGSGFRDKNDISVLQAGGYAQATVWDRVTLHLMGVTGEIHQDAKGERRETGVWRTAGEIGFADLYPTPRVKLWGAFLYEDFSLFNSIASFYSEPDGDVAVYTRRPLSRGYVLGGRLGGAYLFPQGSEMGLELRRESMWNEHNRFDARLFNRVTDLNRMSPDMAVNKLRAFADLVTFPEHKLRLDGGLESLEDGNFRTWGYAHYQVPVLWSRNEHWTVIRPNAYVESMAEQKPGYFSPRSHVTVGCMLHTIQEFTYLDIEAEVNPQLLWTADQTKKADTAAGIHGLVNLTFKLGGVRLGVGGFGYTDTDGYWLLRGMSFLKYTF